MAAYYKTIKGIKYDKALIDLADSLTKGQRDGRLSQKDCQTLVNIVKDGGVYTDIEKKTIAYIRDKYTFTESGNKWFRTEIKKWAAQKKTATTKNIKKIPVKTKNIAKSKTKQTAKKTVAKVKIKAKSKVQTKKASQKTVKKTTSTKEQPKAKISNKKARKQYNINTEVSTIEISPSRYEKAEQKKSKKIGIILTMLLILGLLFVGYLFLDKNFDITQIITTEKEQPQKVTTNKDTDKTEKKENIDTKKDINDPKIKELESIIVYFSKNLGWISPKQKTKLKPIIKYLNENTNKNIIIIGHSCSLGDNQINKGLAIYRAQQAAKYLQKNGIAQQRITLKGIHHNNSDNTETEAERQTNRRVEFDIQ